MTQEEDTVQVRLTKTFLFEVRLGDNRVYMTSVDLNGDPISCARLEFDELAMLVDKLKLVQESLLLMSTNKEDNA